MHVETLAASSAEEFVEILRPYRPRWVTSDDALEDRSWSDEWIFRGQSDSCWPLQGVTQRPGYVNTVVWPALHESLRMPIKALVQRGISPRVVRVVVYWPSVNRTLGLVS